VYGIEEYSDGAINVVCDDVGTFLDHLASSVDEFDGFKLYGYATGSTRFHGGPAMLPVAGRRQRSPGRTEVRAPAERTAHPSGIRGLLPGAVVAEVNRCVC